MDDFKVVQLANETSANSFHFAFSHRMAQAICEMDEDVLSSKMPPVEIGLDMESEQDGYLEALRSIADELGFETDEVEPFDVELKWFASGWK